MEPRVESFDWGRMIWLSEGADRDTSLARMSLAPGQTAQAHCHENCSETLYVLSGAVRVRLDETWRTAVPGDVIVIERGVVHQTSNNGDEDAELMLCYGAGVRAYSPKE